jgi:hypothetical protein
MEVEQTRPKAPGFRVCDLAVDPPADFAKVEDQLIEILRKPEHRA